MTSKETTMDLRQLAHDLLDEMINRGGEVAIFGAINGMSAFLANHVHAATAPPTPTEPPQGLYPPPPATQQARPGGPAPVAGIPQAGNYI